MAFLEKTTVQLTNNVKFTVVHDLKDYGLSFVSEVNNWALKTENYTVESFCNYLRDKIPGVVCLSKENFDLIVNDKY